MKSKVTNRQPHFQRINDHYHVEGFDLESHKIFAN